MSPVAVIILIIVILVVIAAIALGVRAGRRKKLQNTFGPEYDRVVADTGSRADAEKELRERERRHAELELKPLSPESQARYSAAWEEVQIQFVDNPEQATAAADDLVTRLIADRGYPTGDYDDQLANLSVEHARTLGHYRDAHEISQRSRRGEASTEDLRQALVHYRALFADLLGTDPVKTDNRTDAVRTDTADRARTDTADASRTDASRTDVSRTDADRTDSDRTDVDRTGVDRTGVDRTDVDRTDADTTRQAPTTRADAADNSTTTTAPDTDVAGSRPDASSR